MTKGLNSLIFISIRRVPTVTLERDRDSKTLIPLSVIILPATRTFSDFLHLPNASFPYFHSLTGCMGPTFFLACYQSLEYY